MSESRGLYTVQQFGDDFVVVAPTGKHVYWSIYRGDSDRQCSYFNEAVAESARHEGDRLRQDNVRLAAEVERLKADHAEMVKRNRELRDRPDLGDRAKSVDALHNELTQLREDRRVLGEEVRKSRAILGPFGTLRDGIIQEDGLMYEDARRDTDARGGALRGKSTE